MEIYINWKLPITHHYCYKMEIYCVNSLRKIFFRTLYIVQYIILYCILILYNVSHNIPRIDSYCLKFPYLELFETHEFNKKVVI